MYEYRAEAIRIVDGDTIHADVDLGFDQHTRMTLRLEGIDAPERGTPEGSAATAWLRSILLPSGVSAPLTLRTTKDRREKYGRYLATLLLAGVSVNDQMVAAGHAVAYAGGPRG